MANSGGFTNKKSRIYGTSDRSVYLSISFAKSITNNRIRSRASALASIYLSITCAKVPIHHKWERMRERMQEGIPEPLIGIYLSIYLSVVLKLEIRSLASALASALALNLANLIGSDRSHDKWEQMQERILGSGCARALIGSNRSHDTRADARADAQDHVIYLNQ